MSHTAPSTNSPWGHVSAAQIYEEALADGDSMSWVNPLDTDEEGHDTYHDDTYHGPREESGESDTPGVRAPSP